MILSCTDGLTNYLDEKSIFKVFSQNTISSVPSELIREANNLGGSDNITAAVIKI